MIYNKIKNIVLTELNKSLSSFCESDINKFIEELINKRNSNIVAYGAGRMGYGIRAFIMRLMHLGYHAYWYGDTTIPRLGPNDLFIFASASGKTETIVNIAKIAWQKSGVTIISLTGDEYSPLAKLSNLIIKFKGCNNGLNSVNSINKINSIQPMTTLNEQASFIFFDLVALMLMERLNENNNTMSQRHNSIE